MFDDIFGNTPASQQTPSSGGLFGDVFKNTPLSSPSSPPKNYFEGNGYGVSKTLDTSGRPLSTVPFTIPKTFFTPEQKISVVSPQRVATTFDPTKPQKLTNEHLTNGRMPENVSATIKRELGGSYSDELDHKISLELSGSNQRENLGISHGRQGLSIFHPSTWIPTLEGKNAQQIDRLENTLAKRVKDGQISLVDAQVQLAKVKGVKLPESKLSPVERIQNALLRTNPSDFLEPMHALQKSIEDIAHLGGHLRQIPHDIAEPIKSAYTGLRDAAVNFVVQNKTGSNRSRSEKVASGGSLAVAAANAVFTPVNIMFAIGKDIPLVSLPTKLLALPFEILGTGVVMGSNEIINKLPLDTHSKEVLKQSISPLAALVSQIAVGYGISKVGATKALKETMEETIELHKKGGMVVPEMTQSILEDKLAEKQNAPKVAKSELPQTEIDKFSQKVASPKLDSLAKAKADIEHAKELMTKAPKEVSVEDGYLKGIKSKADYQRYIDETQSWIDKKSGISPELDSLAQEARKYKSAEEFVNNQTGYFRGEPSKLDGSSFGGKIKINKDGIPETLSGNMGIPTSKDVNYVNERFVGKVSGELGVYIPKGEVKVLSNPEEILKLANSKTAQDFYYKGKIPEFERGIFWKRAKDAGYDAVDLSKIEDIARKNPPEGVINLGGNAGFESEMRIINPNAFDVKTKSQLTDFYNQAKKGESYAEMKAPKTNERAGYVSPESMIKQGREAIERYKQNQEDSKAGGALRTFFTGERNSRIAETNQLRNSLEKIVKNPMDQEALTLMRDFKNKPGELQQFLDGTHPIFKEIPDKTQALERTEALKPLIERALSPSEAMKRADIKLTEYFTGRLAEGKKLGFLDSNIKNDEYINHLLNPKEPQGVTIKNGGLIKSKIGRRFQFAKTRTYDTVLDAVANGVEPKTLNALDALSIYGDKHAVAAATKILLNELKDSGVGKWGFRSQEEVPQDWQALAPESHLFQNKIPFITEEGKASVANQQFFVPEKIAKALSPIIDPNYLGRIGWFRSLRVYQAFLKAAELSLSFFHLRALNVSALNNMGLIKGIPRIIQAYAKDMESTEFKGIEKSFVQAGGESPLLGKTIEAYKAVRPTQLPSRLDLIRMMPGIKQLDLIASGISKFTFDVTQRKFKVMDFATKDAEWLADNPEATPEEHFKAQKSLAKEINSIYGGLNWEVIGIHHTTLEIMRALILAPDWTYSNVFTAGYAFGGGPAGKEARMFWFRSAITGTALTQGMSLMLSGQTSKDPTSVYLGKDKQGKEVYQNMFFVGAPGDMINLIKNVHDYGAIQGVAQSVAAKVAPVPKEAIQLFTNRNYLGQTIVPKSSGFIKGTGLSLKNAVTNLAPIPFSITNAVQMLLDPNKQFSAKEYFTVLFGGTRPRHVVPDGLREVKSGKKKGQLVPIK